jgi:O-antigen/teichoic acid export membrane protein
VQAIYLMARRPHERSLRVNVQAAKDLLYYGGGHTTARLFNYAALQGDYIVVGRWLSDTALGIYGRAYQLGSTPAQLIGTALDEVLFPTLSSFQDNRTRLGRAYIRAIALTSTLMFPMAVFGVLLGPEIVAVIFGDSCGVPPTSSATRWHELLVRCTLARGARASTRVWWSLARWSD